MPDHKCSTCKHYEPAPMWKKGWCRNPLLYSPQQSHLVGEDDLDCNRGMGSYWEPIDHTTSAAAESAPLATIRDTGRFKPPPPRNIAPPTSPHQAQAARHTGQVRNDAEPIVARRDNQDPIARPRTRQGARGAERLRSRDPQGTNNTPRSITPGAIIYAAATP